MRVKATKLIKEAYQESWNKLTEKVYKSIEKGNYSGAESQLKNFYRDGEEDPDYYYFKILTDIYTQIGRAHV